MLRAVFRSLREKGHLVNDAAEDNDANHDGDDGEKTKKKKGRVDEKAKSDEVRFVGRREWV